MSALGTRVPAVRNCSTLQGSEPFSRGTRRGGTRARGLWDASTQPAAPAPSQSSHCGKPPAPRAGTDPYIPRGFTRSQESSGGKKAILPCPAAETAREARDRLVPNGSIIFRGELGPQPLRDGAAPSTQAGESGSAPAALRSRPRRGGRGRVP